jgi:hypothetical protein
MSQVLSSGRRKYTAILEQLVEKAVCRVECKLSDARTIIDGAKKEKMKWKQSAKWPKGQALKIDIVDEDKYKGVTFRMITDTSINNL